MMTTEARVAAVKERVRARQQQKRLRWIAAGLTAAAFFGGILAIAMIDHLIPSVENPYEPTNPGTSRRNSRLMRMGLFTALAIAIHNFPEGLATFVSALQDPGLAIPVVTAIAIHNIPEGIAVSVPIYQATGSKRRAFSCSFLSGLAEPAGAILGWLILMLNDRECASKFYLKSTVHLIPVEYLNNVYDTIVTKSNTRLKQNWNTYLRKVGVDVSEQK